MATHRTRPRDSRTQGPSATETLEEDIQLAADTNVPVLISGPAPACRAVASEVDRRAASSHEPMEVIDCAAETSHHALAAVVRESSGSPGPNLRCFLLQEVHALSPVDQRLLERHLIETRHATRPPTRILASSSVPLFSRVEEQLFSERLYYLLNVIHIVIPTARRMTRHRY